MIASGLDAIILKVAGIGLSRKHVGKSLGDIRDYLFQLVRMILSILAIVNQS
jgi:diphthine-ammonia ligase